MSLYERRSEFVSDRGIDAEGGRVFKAFFRTDGTDGTDPSGAGFPADEDPANELELVQAEGFAGATRLGAGGFEAGEFSAQRRRGCL